MPVPVADEFRKFHARMPLSGNPLNALLAQPDDFILYLVAAIRSEPCAPPARSEGEWQAFFDVLRAHWIIPLVAFNVRRWPAACQPPPACQEYMNRVLMTATARNMLADRQIRMVFDALREAGIASLLLKGPALARSVYPDPAIRQSADIDLLIQPQHIPAAEDVLEKLGYTCTLKHFHVNRDKAYEENYYPKARGLPIELHWGIDYSFNIFPEGWLDAAFSRRIAVASGDLSFCTLCPADHLQYLAFHGVFQHPSVRLDWIYDVSLVITKITTPEEWKELGRLSVQHNVRIPLELLITAACLWTGCRLPAGAEDFSAWPDAGERELRLVSLSETFTTSLYAKIRLYLQGQKGITQKLRFIFRQLVPPVPMLAAYRRSASALDIPLAYIRRWIAIIRMI